MNQRSLHWAQPCITISYIPVGDISGKDNVCITTYIHTWPYNYITNPTSI